MHHCCVPSYCCHYRISIHFFRFIFLWQHRIHSISVRSRRYRHVINLPAGVMRTATQAMNNYHYLRPWLILAVVNRLTTAAAPLPSLVLRFFFLISRTHIIFIIIYYLWYNSHWVRGRRRDDTDRVIIYKKEALKFVTID